MVINIENMILKANQPNSMEMGPPLRSGDKTHVVLNQNKHLLVDFHEFSLQEPRDKYGICKQNVSQYKDITFLDTNGIMFYVYKDIYDLNIDRILKEILE